MPMPARDRMIGVFLSPEERKMLDTLAEEAGISLSAYVRLLIQYAYQRKLTINIQPKKAEKVAEYV